MLTEHAEQVRLMAWCGHSTDKYPELDLIFAIPNVSYGGGKYNMMRGKKLKAEGRKKGVPDLFLPVARGGFHGLFIEMKRVKGGVVTREQREWLEALEDQGYLTVICRGSDQAEQTLTQYLDNKITTESIKTNDSDS